MLAKELTALSIFTSYFLLIISLFTIIIRSIRWPTQGNSHQQLRIFCVLTLASFGHTWFYMFRFLHWSFTNFEASSTTPKGSALARITQWLINTELFEEAWDAVCSHPLNWWWSEQLCIFTVGAWTAFLAIEGYHFRVKHLWAYMLLGQLVAISVASNLFYLALIVSPEYVKKKRAIPAPSNRTIPPAVWLSVSFAMLTVGLSPLTSDRTFLPNLLAMHALIVLPLIPWKRVDVIAQHRVSIDTFTKVLGLTTILLRVRTTYAAFITLDQQYQTFSGFTISLWTTIYSHPAQSSIGWDVIWTTGSFLVWVLTSSRVNGISGEGYGALIAVVAFSILLSAGVVAPILLL